MAAFSSGKTSSKFPENSASSNQFSNSDFDIVYHYIIFSEIQGSDVTLSGNQFSEIADHNISPTNPTIEQFWNKCFELIDLTENIRTKVGNTAISGFTDSEKKPDPG